MTAVTHRSLGRGRGFLKKKKKLEQKEAKSVTPNDKERKGCKSTGGASAKKPSVARACNPQPADSIAQEVKSDETTKPGSAVPYKATGQLLRWKFETDYNDHFETSLSAIFDLAPLLYLWLECKGVPGNPYPRSQDIIVYDPYYCKGSIQDHFKRIGFPTIINVNRDFYQDIKDKKVPAFDILVTNPPFSCLHKQRCFEFCVTSQKPFAVLVPFYVLTKSYFRDIVKRLALSQKVPVAVLIPPSKYQFEHPEGTGHSTSPFFSVWVVWFGSDTRSMVERYPALKKKAQLVATVEEAVTLLTQTTARRPNPRQRRKLKEATR